jgi:queuine/archaeosine tRNA-ribosyltransferase
MLSTYHNLFFMHQFMRQMREAIAAGEFERYRAHWLAIFEAP